MDYSKCAIPKPGKPKKEKLYNGYKDKANRTCAVTGTNYAERHEIFGASNRQNSIRHGLQVDLSREEHERVTNPRNSNDDNRVEELKIKGQEQYEQNLIENEGYTDVQARKLFMHEFGRNYLDILGKEGV
ncbi:MAG: hypothetical protein AB9836_06145 [Aminipila sp.]